ncbi:MAG TPA: hypothetical protein VM141_00855 [Planctomycetota bacterium]|nr:hypothetical protein [Planctomycetota bacterium]
MAACDHDGKMEQPAVSGNATCTEADAKPKWVIPYIDQPLSFWQSLHEQFGGHISAVYFPLPGNEYGSGRPRQPGEHLGEFLRRSPFELSVLVNAIVMPRPLAEMAPIILGKLQGLAAIGVKEATVTDLLLARQIREKVKGLRISMSVLADICSAEQVEMIKDTCDTLVPSSRVMRDLPSLSILRKAFPGRIRLMVNEACLPGCPFRTQHFYEMASAATAPRSLCAELLSLKPWLRLTGSWVLPQHLHLYDGLYDEAKLAGRVTLRDPAKYRRVLDAYVHRRPLSPDAIGGGPASVQTAMEISEEFFRATLHCGRQCHTCSLCRDTCEGISQGQKGMPRDAIE